MPRGDQARMLTRRRAEVNGGYEAATIEREER